MKNKFLAVIREADCIGCTKCIDACPVDAILGSAKQMHTVIQDECIGCELCLPPCPVDCIDLIPMIHQPDPSHTKIRVLIRKERLREQTVTSPSQNPGQYLADVMKRAKNRPHQK